MHLSKYEKGCIEEAEEFFENNPNCKYVAFAMLVDEEHFDNIHTGKPTYVNTDDVHLVTKLDDGELVIQHSLEDSGIYADKSEFDKDMEQMQDEGLLTIVEFPSGTTQVQLKAQNNK